MVESSKTYIPAAGHHWSLPLYDPMVKLLGGEAARRKLLEHLTLQPGGHILDIGCGTGNLAVMIKGLHPQVNVVGLDPDPQALARDRRKAEQAAVAVQFDRGVADALPYADASMDQVVSSLMFHHLECDDKERMLREVRRVLKPGGVFNLLDFGGPEAGAAGFFARLLHSSQQLKDNSEEQILAFMKQAGLAAPKKVNQGTMMFGRLRTNYYQASSPPLEVAAR